jgi:hypothetical protein
MNHPMQNKEIDEEFEAYEAELLREAEEEQFKNYKSEHKMKTAKIQITEGRSGNKELNHIVRVFVNKDWGYGYWVPETLVFSKLNDMQKEVYMEGDCRQQFEIPIEDAQHLIDRGCTPYEKQKLI